MLKLWIYMGTSHFLGLILIVVVVQEISTGFTDFSVVKLFAITALIILTRIAEGIDKLHDKQ